MKNRIKKWIFRKWQIDFIRWLKPEYKEQYLSLEEYNDVIDTILFARHYFDRTYSTEQMMFLLNMQLYENSIVGYTFNCGRQDGKSTILMDYLCSKQDKLQDTYFMVVGTFGTRHIHELKRYLELRIDIILDKNMREKDHVIKKDYYVRKTRDHYIDFKVSHNRVSFVTGSNLEFQKSQSPDYILIDEYSDEVLDLAIRHYPGARIIAIRTDFENERMPSYRPHWVTKEHWEKMIRMWKLKLPASSISTNIPD